MNETIARITPHNQEIARRYLTAKRAQGVAISTQICCAEGLLDLDRLVGGRAFLDVPASDLTKALDVYASTGRKDSTVRNLAVRLKVFYNWAHDGECPKAIKRALHRQPVPMVKHVTPISEADFQKLLRAVERQDVNEAPWREARRRALLWLFWDSGMRISEILGLRIWSVQHDEKGGARITIPDDAPDLKTGPRSIYVVESAGPLKVWLALHPQRGDPNGLLFARDKNQREPMWPATIDRLLHALCQRAGVRRVHPHLFRHTRATRAAEAGWNEAQMRAYFGWEPGSRMASHYVHLAQAHMEERVRKDAQLDPLGARIRADPHAALAETIAATLDHLERRRSARSE